MISNTYGLIWKVQIKWYSIGQTNQSWHLNSIPEAIILQEKPQKWRKNDWTECATRNGNSVGQTSEANKVWCHNEDTRREWEACSCAHKQAITGSKHYMCYLLKCKFQNELKKIKLQFLTSAFGWLNFDFLLFNSLFHLLFLVKSQVHRRLNNFKTKWTLASVYNSIPPPLPPNNSFQYPSSAQEYP